LRSSIGGEPEFLIPSIAREKKNRLKVGEMNQEEAVAAKKSGTCFPETPLPDYQGKKKRPRALNWCDCRAWSWSRRGRTVLPSARREGWCVGEEARIITIRAVKVHLRDSGPQRATGGGGAVDSVARETDLKHGSCWSHAIVWEGKRELLEDGYQGLLT